MKIGLYGILGIYNFGCEAIVRGAHKFCKDMYPDAEVMYFTYSYKYDKEMLKDLDIKIVPIEIKKTLIDRIVNKIYTTSNCEKRILFFDYEEIINSVDMIFSIGGDIYSIPEVIRGNSIYPYYNSLVDFCDRAIVAGKDVIVYGASVGPFGAYKKAVDYYMKNLKKYRMIICREQVSIDYLKSIGLKNVCFFPDPAFQVKCNDIENKSPKYIGVNLSPLSVNEIYGNYGEENCRKLASLLDRIYESTKMDLLFIPHVVSPDESDNDLHFMEHLQSLMKTENQQHVHYAESKGGFLGLKPQLKQCYLVASARMHCAINAITENVPALFLSYSQKSIGMCEYIYESKKWLVNLKDVESDTVPKIKQMLENREAIVEELECRNKEIKKYYLENIGGLRDVFI